MRTQLAIAALLTFLAPAAPGAELAPDTPLVQHGDVVITIEDMNAALARLSDEQRFALRANLDRLNSAASTLYLSRSLAREARAAGIDKEPEVRKRLQLQEETLLAQLYMERFEKGLKPPSYEARAREVFAASADKYRVPEQVTLRHVMVDIQGRSPEEARRRAEEARAKMLANEPWYAIVRGYSNDSAARSNNGEIGPAPYSSIQAELAEAAKKLSPGETSGLIESPQGFHVITLMERYPPKSIPYETVKKELIGAEELKFRRAAIDKKLGEFTVGKDVVIHTDNFAAFKVEVDRDLIRRAHDEQSKKEQADRDAARKGR